MAGFRHLGVLSQPSAGFVSNVTGLTLGVVGGRLMLYSATHVGGGIGVWHLDGADSLAVSDQAHAYPGALQHMAQPGVSLIERHGGLSLLTTGLRGNTGAIRLLDADGLRGGVDAGLSGSRLPADLLAAGSFSTAAGGQMLWTARQGQAAFTLWRLSPDGRAIAAGTSAAPLKLPAGAQIDAVEHLRIGNVDLIASVSTGGNFLALHRVLPDGTLAPGAFLGSAVGTGFNGPRDLAAVQVEGHHFLIVSSAASSSLTSVRLLPGGQMVPVDHVIDELTTRFQGATVMKAATIDGRAFIVAGGADDGLSLFTLTPDGRFVHLQTIADQDGMSLADVSALAVHEIGGKLVVLAASGTESGISQFVIDPGAIGQTRHVGEGDFVGTDGNDLIQGGLNTTRINGGKGDDILIAGSRSIALTGGPGADVFVPLPVAGRVAIKDYEPGVDRLDLSMLGMIRSTLQLRFQPTANGIKIRFGDTVIDIASKDGRTLLPQMFDDSMFPIVHYQPPDVRTTLLGTARADVLTADRGGSAVWGYAGNDTILGSGLEDHLIGGVGHDRIIGNDGDDTIWGEDGNDFIRGDGGNDRILGGLGHDVILGGDGDDTLLGQAGNDIIYGGAGNDRMNGGMGDDYLAGEDGDDFIFGLGGNDTLSGGAGDDVMIDQDGNNIFRDISGNNMMFGGPGRDRMFGGSGRDTMRPGAGNDFVFGGGGRDLIFAGDGDDTCLGDDGDDLIAGGNGNDWLYGGAGDDFLDGGEGNDRLVGGDGADALTGGAGDDTLLGGAGNDTLRGNSGNDRLYSGAGNDRLLGGMGDDTLMGDEGGDMLLGEAGDDLLGGGAGNDTLDGGWGDDDLYGNGGDDLMFGGAGNDRLRGGTGNDTLHGGEGNDTLNGQAGADLIHGGAGNDLLLGMWDDDTLVGGAGNDTILGGAGDDVIQGGPGADLLMGEGGADVFVWTAGDIVPGDGADTVLGFTAGEDRLDLSALVLACIAENAFSGQVGQLRWTVEAGGITLQVDLDGDALADLTLWLSGLSDLSRDDFIL